MSEQNKEPEIDETRRKLCLDACLVQNACNVRGITRAFIAVVRENGLQPSDPISVMYISKLMNWWSNPASIHVDTFEETLEEMEKTVDVFATESRQKPDEAARFDRCIGRLVKLSGIQTYAVHHAAFEYCSRNADWPSSRLRDDFNAQYGVCAE